jgi:hypothetical protein
MFIVHCCYLLIRIVTNKAQERLRSKNIIRKMEQNLKNKQWGTKYGENISPEHKSDFRDYPQKSGTNGRLSVNKPNVRLWLWWKHIRAKSSVREYDRKRPNVTNPLELPETKYMSESRYIIDI